MREPIVNELHSFARELVDIGKLVLRTAWGRDTAKGLDAVGQLSGFADVANALADRLSGEKGPIEETIAQRLMDLAETAESSAAEWPDETLKKCVEIAATRLRTFVLTRFPVDTGSGLSFR